MLNKSDTLQHLLRLAEELSRADGKKAVSSDYFMAALLRLLSMKEERTLPAEYNNAEALAELTLAEKPLSVYDVDKEKTADAILAAVTREGYNSSMDEFVFAKYAFAAAATAKKKGLSEITSSVYVDMILKEPTPSIKAYLFGESGEKKDEEKAEATESDPFDALLSMLDESTPVGASEEKKELSGAEYLAQTVKETKKIQSMLLECIFGQDRAVNTFVSGYFQAELMARSRAGNRKPQATFLFAGPPGTGKTFLAEKAAEALGRPFQRFDMSEYADKEANIEFCGSDKVYKNGKSGNVTGFVSENPRSVLLFDEIEKAHINVIYLFLQMLDAGRLRDNYTDEEVSFQDTVLIFTTNVGKNLYSDPSVTNLSALPRKKILKALAADKDPQTGVPLFPAAICSRFASGNVVMFNHLSASNLHTIARREIENNIHGFEEATGIDIAVDDRISAALMFSEGGKADARTVKGRANAFFYEELYELFRLLGTDCSPKKIKVSVSLDGAPMDVAKLFTGMEKNEVLVFADREIGEECKQKLTNTICHVTQSVEEAKELLFNRDITLAVCDVRCGMKNAAARVLNAEDIDSAGRDFLNYLLSRYTIPAYLLEMETGGISPEEFLSFAKLGVEDVLTLRTEAKGGFKQAVTAKCDIAYSQSNMLRLARENKVLSYKTAQTLSDDGEIAEITLQDFCLSLATDTEDSKSILENVSKPKLGFGDVIGAEDAKGELKYFVEYLKDPIRFIRKGVRAPKGVLLYGPPGTGKTLLAKAMAGESDVTFLTAEGNQFLKRYVGEGAEAVHDIFNAARKYAPSILFIDEIDAIGKDRNTQGSSDNTSDVLTAFLTEMDGFNTDTSKPVFVLAATNYEVEAGHGKSLDAALVRRFDRKIYIDLPTKEERRRYLKMKIDRHASVCVSEEEIENIAVRSTGMSLAELELVFEMALRSAIRSDSGTVGDEAFEEAFETYQSGEKKPWNPASLERTARHEAGHALLCCLSGEIPSYLTVVARASHGGYMQHADSEDKPLYTKEELLWRIRTSLGGRAAELVCYGERDGVSTGASGDLQSATAIATRMVCSYGMDEKLGLAAVDGEVASSAPYLARVNEILRQQMEAAVSLIRENREILDRFTKALLEKNHLKGDEIEKLFRA